MAVKDEEGWKVVRQQIECQVQGLGDEAVLEEDGLNIGAFR